MQVKYKVKQIRAETKRDINNARVATTIIYLTLQEEQEQNYSTQL